MHKCWIESEDYGVLTEPTASACLKIVALFLVSQHVSGKTLAELPDVQRHILPLGRYTCFRSFSLEGLVNQLTRYIHELRPEGNWSRSLSPVERVSWLMQCFHKLQPSNTEAHLKQIADLTFHSHQREAIQAALELLKAWRGTVDGSACELLFQMIRVFELSDGDAELLLTGCLCV